MCAYPCRYLVPAGRAVFREAVPAVDRPTLGGFERHFAISATFGTLGRVHLTGSAVTAASTAVAAAMAAVSAFSFSFVSSVHVYTNSLFFFYLRRAKLVTVG